MSDSLRDQLLKAGFSQSKTEKPDPKLRKRKKTQKTSSQSEPKMSIAEAKAAAKLANKSVNKAAARQRYQTVSPSANAGKNKTRKAPAIKRRTGGWGARPANETVAEHSPIPSHTEDSEKLDGGTEIRALIESSALKECGGAEVYRFTVQNKIHEVLISESIKQQLVDGQLAITRLKGVTHIIPEDTARRILIINSQWLIVIATQEQQLSADYDEFPIPDDLTW